MKIVALVFSFILSVAICQAQVAPSAREIAEYDALQIAVYQNDVRQVQALLPTSHHLNSRDNRQRTPLLIAAYAGAYDVFRVLIKAGADPKAMDFQNYDAITIAAVANDAKMLKIAIELGGNASAVTSPYEGTALIAAAHLGHVEVVNILISAGSPLDHINNLNWTALIEAVILGNGGPDHIAIVQALLDAGANRNISDNDGLTPLDHATELNYLEMIESLK